MQQRTKEWLEFRKNKIGASDAPCIMGVGFKTPLQLWKTKRGELQEEEAHYMHRGTVMEPEALKRVEDKLGMQFFQPVVTHKELPWMIASMDGLDFSGKTAVEIKCPGRKDHSSALEGKIPEKYFPQLQHQLEVCELDKIFYYSFDGNDGVLLELGRDDKYIKKMISKEEKFYECMLSGEAPPLSDKDYVLRDDQEWRDTEVLWADAYSRLKEAKDAEEKLRKALIELSENANSMGQYARLTAFKTKGRVNYSKIPELIGVDLDQYRGNDIESYRLSSI